MIRAELDLLARYRVARGRLGPLPDFLLLGVMKGGTTSFWGHLQETGLLNPNLPKETLYFDQYATRRSVAWYRSFFWEPCPPPNRLNGDGTLTNLPSAHAPARAAALVPDARLVVLLRDPVARATSHYFHMTRRGEEPRTLREVIEAEAAELAAGAPVLFTDPGGALPRFSYLRRGHYAPQLKNWLRHYDRSQLCVVVSEEYFADPQAEIRRFLEFAGRVEVSIPPARRAGEQRDQRVEDARLLEELTDHFRADVHELQELLGRSLPWVSAQ